MIDVHENCPFTETTLKLSSIEKLSLRHCRLKVEDTLDTLSQLKTLKFKNTSFKLHGEDVVSLNTLKEMLNPSTSNLEFLSLDLPYSPTLEEYLDFVSPGFPRLRTLQLCLTEQLTLGELASYSRLHRALSKPPNISVLVLKVQKLLILDKSQLKEYQALGIEGSSIPRVLGLVQMKYGIKIEATWEGSGKMAFRLRGQGWEVTVKVYLNQEHNFIKII
jgi:hypothetical protein